MPPPIGQLSFIAAALFAPLILAAVFAISPWCSPPLALAIGMVLGLLGLVGWGAYLKVISRYLIQGSIVILGFWISLADVARAGLAGLALSTGAIVVVVILSELLTRTLRTERQVGTLLSAGTAICGGSAIAATGQVIRASSGNMAIATAIVFLLNAVGVYTYPLIARWLGLTDHQFGAWAAVGIHDLAGVVAASAGYMGTDVAQQDATVIKLTRVLWIVPVALLLAWQDRRSAPQTDAPPTKSPFPWFIVFFIGACLLRAVLEQSVSDPGAIVKIAGVLKQIAGSMLSLALLLIGAGLTRQTLKAVGWRPAVHAVALWVTVSVLALLAIRATIA
ncbi:MAG: putative sulfate exporter family transporter [Phycisphaerales bacterium]|nr:putative sulfate exporter family transporter [Phycisphaerales bacterium]